MADFLHRIAIDEVQDRLGEVNRTFRDIAVVTGHPAIWSEAFPDALILPDNPVLDFPPDHQFDLVIHAMALHWADDPVGQMIQCARALRPDGMFMAVCPGGDTLIEARTAMTAAEAEISGGLSPRILPMGEIRDLGGLMSRAGLALPVADLVRLPASYRDLFHLSRELRAMGEGNALAGRLRHPSRRALFDRAARIYAERFPDRDDPSRVQASFDLIFLTGWSPADNQQKPLRPGSAQMRLADALQAAKKDESD